MVRGDLKDRVLIDARNKAFKRSHFPESLKEEFYIAIKEGSVFLIDKSKTSFTKEELLEMGAKTLNDFPKYLFLDFEKNNQRAIYEPVDSKEDKYSIRNVISLG